MTGCALGGEELQQGRVDFVGVGPADVVRAPLDGDGKKVAVATGSAVVLPGRPATVTTELTLPPLDEGEGDPPGYPSGYGG